MMLRRFYEMPGWDFGEEDQFWNEFMGDIAALEEEAKAIQERIEQAIARNEAA